MYQPGLGGTNLVITVPCPELDKSTVGINPEGWHVVKSIPCNSMRSTETYLELEEECKRVTVNKQYATFGSLDVITDAKVQAQRVLTNFYRECVDDRIGVDVKFVGEYKLCAPNADVKASFLGL